MKKLITLIFLVITYCGFSQNKVSSVDLFQIGFNDELILNYNGRPFTGISFGPTDCFGNKNERNGSGKVVYENRSLEERERIKKEKGDWNDIIYDMITWVNGKKNGEYKCFGKPDLIIKKGYYKNNIRDSLEEGFSKYDGTLDYRKMYKMGKLNGPHETYNGDGSILHKGTYVNDIEFGKFEIYYINGKLHRKGTYVFGKNEYGNTTNVTDGVTEQYYNNGQLEERIVDTKGIHNGLSERYFYDGKLKEKCTYINGNIVGPYISYYSDGQLRSKFVFKLTPDKLNSYYDGQYEIYYPNGQIQIKCTYKMGVLTGIYEEYTEDGTLVTKDNYINGEKNN